MWREPQGNQLLLLISPMHESKSPAVSDNISIESRNHMLGEFGGKKKNTNAI
jgi:hypothetical protein